jgi:quercetin dioxygenase-like cupin family protein
VRNMPTMKFAPIPGLPTCAPASVQHGDPTKEPSVILGKLAVGCSIPWHWHTPNEHVMMISGVARVEMKDAKPVVLRAGGYALMPSHHIHQFRCTTPCALFVYSDAAFDIHYVDGQAKEISPENALRAVKETTAQGTK